MDTWRNVSHVSKFKKKMIKGRKVKRKENEESTESESEKEGVRKGKKEFFHFPLRSTEIGPSVFVGVRRKVDPHIKS